MLTTDEKGAVAEAAVALAAAEAGILVLKPLAEGARYDLAFDLGGRFVRVQCKWASRYRDIVTIRCYSSRRCRDGFLKRAYCASDVDAVAAYCPPIRRCFLVPMEYLDGRTQFDLRLSSPQNNQRRRINWADEWEFEATLRRLGAIAQLGERVAGSDEVAGSSPAGSTSGGLASA